MEESKKKLYTSAQKKAIYKYRETHKDVVAGVFAKWKAKNVDHLKNYSAQYYQKNKEKILQRNRMRYALKSESEPVSESDNSPIILSSKSYLLK
jgi:F420-0:gamma-glutamyl ligase-like protein